ncbi:MAG TPA: hypothetical protein PKD84_11390 [Propionicimonas sp.]|nr:hypothetical protein [Propionicimonas sp.]
MRRWVSRVVLGAITPVSLFLVGWWIPYLVGAVDLVAFLAPIGLVLGLIADATLLRNRLDRLYSLSVPIQAAIAAFYTVMIYGFFMGLPIPVLLVSLGWGYVAVQTAAGGSAASGQARWSAIGSAALMLAACAATAWLAFREPWIADEVRGMLGLTVTPSLAALVLASAVGGMALVATAYAIPAVLIARHRRRFTGSIAAS